MWTPAENISAGVEHVFEFRRAFTDELVCARLARTLAQCSVQTLTCSGS